MQILKQILKILSFIFKPRDKRYGRKVYDTNSLIYRLPTQKELDNISSEWQSGMELIGWHYLSSRDEINSKIMLEGIQAVISDCHNKRIKFPEAEFKNIYDLDKVLGYVYGDVFVNEFNWEWIYLIIKDDNPKWAIISPNRKLIIRTNRIFINHFLKVDTFFDFIRLYNQVKYGKLKVGKKVIETNKTMILN